MPNSMLEMVVGYLLPTVIFFGSYLFVYFKILKPQADQGKISPFLAVGLAVALGVLVGCTLSLLVLYGMFHLKSL